MEYFCFRIVLLTPLLALCSSVTYGAAEEPVGEQGARFSRNSAPEMGESEVMDVTEEWSGFVSFDPRLFFRDPLYPGQDKQNFSIAFRPEYFRDWSGGEQQFSFIGFLRYDVNDDKRTHADIRELYWRGETDRLALKSGVDVVFWGVTESRHLVDIINQTDLVENIDREDKLGQPMFNLDYMTDWGIWQLYLLPYFRERTFPGQNGRLRTNPPVDTDNPIYESDKKEKHVDLALRWSHYIGDWDIGVAHFSGTSRDPLFIPGESGGKPSLRPVYVQIDQSSVDIQVTKGAWLWKLEAIYNQNKVDDFFAYVGGFEYTWFGMAGTQTDLGWLLEHNYDERGAFTNTILQNDVFFGLRLSGSDVAGSALLAGVTLDADHGSTIVNIEASRRLGSSWTLLLEMRLFSNIDEKDPLYQIRNDDYVEIQLARYF